MILLPGSLEAESHILLPLPVFQFFIILGFNS